MHVHHVVFSTSVTPIETEMADAREAGMVVRSLTRHVRVYVLGQNRYPIFKIQNSLNVVSIKLVVSEYSKDFSVLIGQAADVKGQNLGSYR